MKWFIILVNLAIAIITAMGVYDFTNSYLWAGASFFVLGGAASANPIFAFLALPAVQWIFGEGLTWHTYAVWGLNTLILVIGLFSILLPSLVPVMDREEREFRKRQKAYFKRKMQDERKLQFLPFGQNFTSVLFVSFILFFGIVGVVNILNIGDKSQADYTASTDYPTYSGNGYTPSYTPSQNSSAQNINMPQHSYAPSQTKPYDKEEPLRNPFENTYSRPKTAPNGKPWPKVAAYVPGYPKLMRGGLSSVTVDNTQNNSDVFVKLFSLENPKVQVRAAFIPAFGQFTMDKIKPGLFDVRYQDLDSGAIAKTEQFYLKEQETYGGTVYDQISLTLYKVQGGNMSTYSISPSEFQ